MQAKRRCIPIFPLLKLHINQNKYPIFLFSLSVTPTCSFTPLNCKTSPEKYSFSDKRQVNEMQVDKDQEILTTNR